MGRKDKKQKTQDDHGFIKDGMETDEIRNIVQDIMLYIEENRNKMEYKMVLESMKENVKKINFFETRYPMLYEMVTNEGGFNYQNLEYFLKMRENIVQNKISSEEASKVVGQVWFDKFYKGDNGENKN
jgi:hypothetical protein